jgi:Protein of unknown function (DUF3500)
MKLARVLLLLLWLSTPMLAQTSATKPVNREMTSAVQSFMKTLDSTQRKQATYPFVGDERFDWHYIPRDRKGLPLKRMTPPQRKAALHLLQTVLSDSGRAEVAAIIDLENVLRVVENRPPNDTRRDPENYAFTVFGDPGQTVEPWGWRMEGHHISLHFSSLNNDLLAVTPFFLGSNPGHVLAELPQKGERVLHREEDLGFALLHSLSLAQRKQAMLGDSSPIEIVTANSRKTLLINREGLPMREMTPDQQRLFRTLLLTYTDRYRLTLARQQMQQLEKAGLGEIRFGWMGDTAPIMGRKHGHYYRIHGPTILIEFDNTQNDANHIHTVVRDLTNDFGEDALRAHYQRQHK